MLKLGDKTKNFSSFRIFKYELFAIVQIHEIAF